MKRLSTINNDGSFSGEDEEHDPAASVSSLLREDNPHNTRAGTFGKRAIVGEKYNITGTLRGTGMRGTTSSPADFSSDVYEPAMQRHHSYGNLSSGPRSGCEGHSDDIVDAGTSPRAATQKYLTRKEVKERLREKGIDERLQWGNAERDVTGIALSSGRAIGRAQAFQIPRTLPPVNSFALTKQQPLDEGSATQHQVQDRIEMSMDDWYRLRFTCPQFPLRDSHLDMKFVKGDAKAEGRQICIRGGISRINGKIEEQAYCFYHERHEFSNEARLLPMPVSAETLRIQKKAGRELIWMLLAVPVVGWVFLYFVWKQDPGHRVTGYMMRWKTEGVVSEMGDDEIQLAGRGLAWFGLGFTGVAFASLVVLLWAFL